ncbi:riboflavin synthase subunit alpha [Ectothiorhodospira haloalkaliphila]|uniref:Riboflavin synthase n=1 Tax=Ectothiorhodospira haloalkaliphila TaxID=421628 RepID=W8KJ68_9GAMM|nr:riboflavin synthase [Ectothiorhodospira haloalkaliphila]AHK79193.1 riboflavin synthase subunit alpha [Ectothiorhodospira haloalkaliphila]
MFTGIIQSVGSLAATQDRGGDCRLTLRTGKLDLTDVQLGDSIAVNGVCLTAVALPGDGFEADVSRETLSKTSLGALGIGDPVNLEKALTPTTRLGGHLVSGHVDGLGEVTTVEQEARSWRYHVRVPDELARYIAPKGSVCIDGVSLTVNTVEGAVFTVNIVPHTQQETIINGYRVGTRVNIEVDIIARYLERLLLGDKAAQPKHGISEAFLAEHGFLK